MGIHDEMNELEGFIVSARYIDHFWQRPLVFAGRYFSHQRELFTTITQGISESYDETDAPRNWRYKIASELTSDILRINDSILSQLRAGHPDTALGTVRQLFELTVALKVVSIDKTGEAAKRYQYYEEANYLEKAIKLAESVEEATDYRRRLEAIKREYPGTKFSNDTGWVELDSGRPARRMDDVIDFVVDNSYDGPPEREFFRSEYKWMWLKLNKWAHITKYASRRKLGTRQGSGYLRAHLVEKSKNGLDTPFYLANLLVQETMETYSNIASDLIGEVQDQRLYSRDVFIVKLSESMKGVDRDLIADDIKIGWLVPGSSSKATSSSRTHH